MGHLHFCVDEIAAELDALFDADAHVRALSQLDAREARGETLDVIDAVVLRQSLERAIENNALTQAKRKLEELRSVADGIRDARRKGERVVAIEAISPTVAVEPENTVIAFPRYQTRIPAATPAPERSGTSGWRDAARVAVIVLAMIAASALTHHHSWKLQSSVTAFQSPFATAEAVCGSGCQSNPEAP